MLEREDLFIKHIQGMNVFDNCEDDGDGDGGCLVAIAITAGGAVLAAHTVLLGTLTALLAMALLAATAILRGGTRCHLCFSHCFY